ncbi:hypothetical protein [Chitinophaga cymbidii]|uniref:Uncharacterized protein n=1 Tax=Chitinophaga cymbidii TaxID=1096750 RepID=A0A512RPS9_9BACT|nr:hypothetical protein [Chitinophaga cymbidii]GEP97702.1 hypothetical protein CCY01nite_39620 [Chitinophaga cymbidii]
MPIQVSMYEIAVAVVVGVLGLYYWWLHRAGVLKFSKAHVPEDPYVSDDILPRQPLIRNTLAGMVLPPAVETDLEHEPDTIDEAGFEMLDDADQALLKEAEKVVDKIQDTINHIASAPPNPEEVNSKIRSIVAPYKFLQETEYYDSINTYIALSVERDCGIAFTKSELASLWD